MIGRVAGFALHHYTENLSFGDPAKNGWDARKGAGARLLDRRVVRDRQGSRPHGAPDHEPLGRDRRVRSAARGSSCSSTNGAPGTRPAREAHPDHLLGQQSTMRDAVVAGLTLDTFHRHADKVAMANIAQLVNCLQSLFIAHEDQFFTTPTYHVFDLYGPHVGGQARADGGVGAGHLLPAPEGHRLGPGSQRIGQREGQDADADGDQPARQRGAGGRDRGPWRGRRRGEGSRSSARRTSRRTTRSRSRTPWRIKDATVATVQNGMLVHRFPPASVTRLQFTLG